MGRLVILNEAHKGSLVMDVLLMADHVKKFLVSYRVQIWDIHLVHNLELC